MGGDSIRDPLSGYRFRLTVADMVARDTRPTPIVVPRWLPNPLVPQWSGALSATSSAADAAVERACARVWERWQAARRRAGLGQRRAAPERDREMSGSQFKKGEIVVEVFSFAGTETACLQRIESVAKDGLRLEGSDIRFDLHGRSLGDMGLGSKRLVSLDQSGWRVLPRESAAPPKASKPAAKKLPKKSPVPPKGTRPAKAKLAHTMPVVAKPTKTLKRGR